MSDDDLGGNVYVHVKEFANLARAEDVNSEGFMLGMLLLTGVYYPAKIPFEWNSEDLSRRIKAAFPGRDFTPEKIESLRGSAALLFEILEDGRWVPSPKYFSVNNGNIDL